MKKKLLATLLAVCMLLSMIPVTSASGTVFADVEANDWFADEVAYVYDNGLMNGVGTSSFAPDGTVTRAMVWTTLARMNGVNTEGGNPWWQIGQKWAMENEISDGTMAEALITREQLVTMFWRYAKYANKDVSIGEDTNILSYADATKVNEWAVSAMQWACGAGLINGINGALQPQGYATRAQLAAILYRFAEVSKEPAKPEDTEPTTSAEYTVTFMWNYDDKGVFETVKVKNGETVGTLREPTRTGYNFSGWCTKSGERFALDTKITSDAVIYAKWIKASTVAAGGGGGGHTHDWVAGTPVAPTCSAEGYTPYTCSCGRTKNDDIVPATVHVAGEKCPHCGITFVETAEQLIAAAQGAGDVEIKMIADITLDVAPWEQLALGSANTTSIIIDGENGDTDYTLTFNQTNSDWNNVATLDATLVLKNMNITNCGNNNGPWNRHDINFECDVEMENVNSDKALAFKANADLTNVVINDANTSDTYAIWIQPNGQTVSLNECTIDMLDCTDGRGIKIDEQYVDAPAKVTLNVSGTTFKTEEKSAILVKSVAGADITLSEVNIRNVAADSENEVWVDEASAAYQHLVTVTGGNKILEGAIASIEDIYYTSLADAVDAVENGQTIVIFEGEYDEVLDVCGGKTFTVAAEENKEVTIAGVAHESNGTPSTVTFENITIDNSIVADGWFTGTAPNIIPCVGAWGGNLTFSSCTFEVAGTSKRETGVMTWWTGDNLMTLAFNDCVFNGIDDHASARAMQIYGKVNMTVTECEFNTKKDYSLKYVASEGCTATFTKNTVNNSENFVELGSSAYPGSKYTVYINNTILGTGVSNYVIANDENQTVYVDGVQMISTASALAAALTANEESINIVLTDDVEIPISSLGTITPGSGEYKLGGEDTEEIIIDLNGNKLTISTTYWSALGAVNADATFTIKNGSMTSSQATGTWNSYDLTFANCNYEFEDVVFDKAVALCNEGKTTTFTDVTINESHDYYALWITAEGQTVTLDGLTVNSDGRGIKIDEQYVDAPAKVTLNIKDATFTTVKKAAVLVKSAAGADITVDNIDITGVTTDTTNAVWVDADAAAYADLVTVTGASKIVEP